MTGFVVIIIAVAVFNITPESQPAQPASDRSDKSGGTDGSVGSRVSGCDLEKAEREKGQGIDEESE